MNRNMQRKINLEEDIRLLIINQHYCSIKMLSTYQSKLTSIMIVHTDTFRANNSKIEVQQHSVMAQVYSCNSISLLSRTFIKVCFEVYNINHSKTVCSQSAPADDLPVHALCGYFGHSPQAYGFTSSCRSSDKYYKRTKYLHCATSADVIELATLREITRTVFT